MTEHIWKYIHKRSGFWKADKQNNAVETKPVGPPPSAPEPKQITEDTVHDYVKQNPDKVHNYSRNERIMKTQRKQINARSLLSNAF